jgi:hypothetical protein
MRVSARNGDTIFNNRQMSKKKKPDVDNCYFLNEKELKKMRELGSSTVIMESGSGIGIVVKCLDKKGNWIDITDYSCW